MCARMALIALVAALVAATCPAALAQGEQAPNDDQQRLRQEQAEQFRQMGQQGVMGQVIAIGADGRGNITRIGPGMREEMPEQIILTGATVDVVYVIRGYMIYRYQANRELVPEAEADMRTDDEAEQMEAAAGAMIWPDPAMVPVKAQFAPNSNTLIVLRGGYLLQFSDQLELLAEFDLRTEAEKRRPRVQMRMGPAGPPPPPGAPADAPPPPPQ